MSNNKNNQSEDKFKNTFEKKFFNGKRCEFITIIDKLIDRLPINEKWAIDTLINYLNYLYLTNWFERTQDNYIIFDIRLSDYQCNDLFFIMKGFEGDKYECISEGKYFFTIQEFKNITNIELYTNKSEKIEKENYLQLLSDINRDNFSIDILNDDRTNKDGKYYSGWEHIIIDGCDNFPINIINVILNAQYKYIKYDTFLKLKEKLKQDKEMFECIQGIINRAIKRSVTKAKRDITTIAPICYFPERANQTEIHFVLPLYLLRNNKPDCVLVFNYLRKQKKYYGTTLLNLREALQDARIFGSTEQYFWLKE